MPTNLSDVPRLTVTTASERGFTATFDPSPYVVDRAIGCFCVEDSQFVWGRFSFVNLNERTCLFQLDNPDELRLVEVGHSYPYFDGYWGERAAIVLDRRRDWKRERFVPRDALNQFGQTITGGWDHEHCAICWAKIGNGGEPEAFFDSAHDTWLCETCYTAYVKTASLSFIGEA